MTITGGKWTTYRKMAEDTIDHAALLAQLDLHPSVTKDLPIHGFHKNTDIFGDLAVYGSDAPAIQNILRDKPEYQLQLHPDMPTLAGEVVWAVRNEMARTVEDFLARRTRSLLLNARASIEMAPKVAVIIKPLPTKGRTDDFFGAVGDFSIESSTRQTEVLVNEEIVHTVTVKGTGNTGAITSPVEPDLSSFKSYSLIIKEDITKNSDLVGGKKWIYSFIPKKHGRITIQPFRLSYFNQKDHRYHTVSTKPVILNVRENNQAASKEKTDTVQRSDIQKIATDIRFIKPDKKTGFTVKQSFCSTSEPGIEACPPKARRSFGDARSRRYQELLRKNSYLCHDLYRRQDDN